MTHLRNMMLEELQRRNYSQNTTRAYVRVIRELAKHFHQPPDRLGPDHIRQFQAYLFRERKLEPNTVVQYSAGLRFFFVKTLKRHFMVDNIPLPKQPWKLPIILSQQEVSRLIDAASNLMHRAILMTLYSTGMRRAELCHLQVTDIDKKRMVIHIHQGKGQRDRDVDLSEKLLETLREYWRWMRPKTYLFPGTVKNWRADVPITGKVVWAACRQATKRAGIQKRVYPHLLRHCYATHWLESGGDLRFHGELRPLAKPSAFAALCGEADQRKWVVYAKPPFGGPEQVLKYLARYVQRVAISNSRLLSLENGRVAFEWKDYSDRNRSKTMTLHAVEFIRRFLLHLLPSGLPQYPKMSDPGKVFPGESF